MAVIEIKVPSIAESITEVTLSQWLKADGEYVKRDEPICEFESDKATLELPAEFAGKLIHVATEGSDLNIGDVVAKIDTDAVAPNAPTPAPPAPKGEAVKTETAATVTSTSYATGTPSPAAGKILAEAGVSTTDVSGTGRDGRITKEDAQQAAATPAPKGENVAAAPKGESVKPETATPSVNTASFSRNEHRVKMSRMRQTIAKRLVSAKNTTAMLTTFNEVDMTAVFALREKYQDKFVKKYGVKLGFMSIFGKACAKVLLEMPDVNAYIDSATNEIIYHDFADISLAISTPNGLVVPPIRNVESLSFADFEKQLKGLAVKARDGKLTLDEMSGGTFTITNGGIFGSLMSTPIINEPQSAILGMHAIKDRPMVVDGQIVVRPMMYLALSYDHRVIDGSTSVTFLVKVKELIEDPTSLLLDL